MRKFVQVLVGVDVASVLLVLVGARYRHEQSIRHTNWYGSSVQERKHGLNQTNKTYLEGSPNGAGRWPLRGCSLTPRGRRSCQGLLLEAAVAVSG